MFESSQRKNRQVNPWTESITEILGVHLHRYLMPLLSDHKLSHLWIMMGFEASCMKSVTLRVSPYGCEVDDLGLDYLELLSRARGNEDLSTVMTEKLDNLQLSIFPILSISEPGREHVHAFSITSDPKVMHQEIFTVALRTRINEAIRAFRHNSLRIIFDDSENHTPKEFLSRILDTIPVWCGADHSASLILSSSLESMVMSSAGSAHFQIVAEKLYVKSESGKEYDNLTSLEFVVNEQSEAGLLGFAFDEVRKSKAVGLNIFIDDGEGTEWFVLGESQKTAHRFATNSNRPAEQMTVLLPLLCDNELGSSELLGFLSINFFETMPLSSLTSRVLETLAKRLGTYLRRSSFFSLSAQQLWLLECVREEQLAVQRLCRNVVNKTDKDLFIRTFIGNVIKLVAQSTKVPCFAIGYKTLSDAGEEILRFVSPHGFTHFSDIDLPIHAVGANSSLSTLAVRLNRTITLTGGVLKDGQTVFDNEIYVNESRGIMVDRRVYAGELNESWTRLGDYYKPSREGSYAAISYPIRMKDDVAGVILVEVDRDTDWIWWAGFGSYLFYRLLSNELSADFAMFGMDLDV